MTVLPMRDLETLQAKEFKFGDNKKITWKSFVRVYDDPSENTIESATEWCHLLIAEFKKQFKGLKYFWWQYSVKRRHLSCQS